MTSGASADGLAPLDEDALWNTVVGQEAAVALMARIASFRTSSEPTPSILRFLDRFAGRKQNTHLAIAGLVVSAGQYQVAHAGKAHKCIVPCPECHAEAGHFDQTTIDQRDAGICAEAETIRNPGTNG